MLQTPPLSSTSSSMLLKLFRVFLEQSQICHPHIALQFLGCFIWIEVFPLHLYLSNGAIREKNSPPVENIVCFHQKISFGFYLNHIPVDHMSSIVYILFQYGNMKDNMYSKIRCQSYLICHWPHSCQYFEWSTIPGC